MLSIHKEPFHGQASSQIHHLGVPAEPRQDLYVAGRPAGLLGILLGVGSSLTSDAVKQSMPFLDNTVLQLLFLWMTKVGLVAFIYLPVMFAVAIPLGLAREEKGVAAFAGFVGYAALNLSINFYLTVANVIGDAAAEKAYGVKSILGISSIDTGILGAIIVG